MERVPGAKGLFALHAGAVDPVAGLEVRTDAFGNPFGRREGADPEAQLVLTGSRFDTALNAGC